MSLIVSIPEDLHEWVSFEDPEEERTYMFDVSYMLSNWMCIYGQGCQGIHEEATPELMQGCCSFGAHFIDADDVWNPEKLELQLAALERMPDAASLDPEAFNREWGITAENLRRAKPDAIVMHPGPMNRGVEIDSAVADGPHAVILPQVTFGIAVRMAVMSIVAGNDA